MEIYVNNQQTPYPVMGQQWEAYLACLGNALECLPETVVSLTFTDNETVRYLNRTYRETDRHTDVLSFQQDMQNNLLGDIVISVEQAEVQAKEKQQSLERELALLVTHGFLHLLGYDHAEEEDEKQMFAYQEELLSEHFPICFGENK